MKVVVPKFVAKVIEIYKEQGKPLRSLLDVTDHKDYNDWLADREDAHELDALRCELVARAWLDGYLIEGEEVKVRDAFEEGAILLRTIKNSLSLEQGFDAAQDDFSVVQLYDDNQGIIVRTDYASGERELKVEVSDSLYVLPPKAGRLSILISAEAEGEEV